MPDRARPTPESGPERNLQSTVRTLALLAHRSVEARAQCGRLADTAPGDADYAEAQQTQTAALAEAKLSGALIVLETMSSPPGVDSWMDIVRSAETEVAQTGSFVDLGDPSREV